MGVVSEASASGSGFRWGNTAVNHASSLASSPDIEYVTVPGGGSCATFRERQSDRVLDVDTCTIRRVAPANCIVRGRFTEIRLA